MTTARSIVVTSPIRMFLAIFVLIVSASADDRGFKVVGWGVISDQVKTYPAVPDDLGLTNILAIAAGGSHALALRADGTLVQWGYMWDGTKYVAAEPVPPGLKGVVGIAVGTSHSMALRSDGSVAVWARIPGAPTSVPAGLSRVLAISGADWHCLGLRSDGTVAVWGGDVYGSTVVPPDLSRVVSIAASTIHNLALKSDGTVVPWGKIWLKDNDFANEVVPPGLTNVSAIAAGANHSLALKTDGTVVAWGSNLNGQIDVRSGLRDVVAIAANPFMSLALKSDGTVTDWGLDPVNYAIPAGLTRVVAISAGRSFKLALVPNGNEKLPPILFMHPFSHRTAVGATLVLKADAVGEQLGYQWRKDGSDIPDANRSVYVIDNVRETNRGIYSVVVSNPYGSVTSSNAVISVATLGDLEFPTDTYHVTEGAGTIYIQVIRRGSLASAATIQYSTHPETATAGTDYTETSGELRFAVNQGTNVITLPILDDQIPESDETFTLTLTGDGLGDRTAARVHILDNDAPIEFQHANYTVTQGVDAHVVLAVGRKGTGGSAVTLNYATHAGSATPGVDYIETSGTIQFDAGQNYKEVSIPILRDDLPGPARSFTVTLSGDPLGPTNTARVTILDAELGFAFTQEQLTVTEGVNSNATIEVTRYGPLTTTGVVAYRTFVGRGSATPGTDYREMQGTLEFAPGERTKRFDVPILDDTLAESAEFFVAILSAGSTNNSSVLAEKMITVHVLDDDRALGFSQQDYYVQEGAEPVVTLTVVRGGTAVASRARVLFATLSATATAGSDYVETSGELDFAPGETSKSFTITLLDSGEVEAAEAFLVKLFALEGALGQATTATVHIQDDERGFEFSGSPYLTEGVTTNAILTVHRVGSNAPPATVRYATRAGTAKPGEDYIETTGTLDFAAGENSRTISIQIIDDNRMEPFEFFTVTLTSETRLGSRTVAEVNITDDDRPFEFTQNSVSISELNASAVLNVTRSGTSSDHARILYATRADTATPGLDYTETNGVLDFAPGEKSKSITIPILDDREFDGLKTFTVTLFPLEGTLGERTNVTVEIQDNERLQNEERPVLVDLSFTNLARPNGPVQVLSRLPDGKILMGGSFTRVDDHSTLGVARLNFDGSLDDSFTSSLGAGSSIQDLAPTEDGGVLIAGSLFRGGETQPRALARLKADGTWNEDFSTAASLTIDNLGNQPAVVRTIQILPNGRIIVGGSFQFIGGVSRNGFARLNNDGTLDTSFNPNWGPARKLRVQEDGHIVASYGFGGFLARFSPDGQRDSAFQPAIEQSIYDFELQPDGRIFIAGDFRKVGGLTRPGLARLNANGTVDDSFAVTPAPVFYDSRSVWKVWQSGDGGAIAHSSAFGLFRTSRFGAVDTRFGGIGFSDGQAVLPEANGSVLIGGGFTHVGPFAAPYLARLRPDRNGTGVTFAESQILADEENRFAEITLDRWGTLDGSISVRVRTADSRAAAGRDYAAANQEVTFASGERQKSLRIPILADGLLEGPEDFFVTLDQVTPGVALGSGASLLIQDNEAEPQTDRTFHAAYVNGFISALASTSDGHLYLSGGFSEINGMTVRGIARLEPDGTFDTTFRLDGSFNVHGRIDSRALAVQSNSQLIVGGWNPETGGGTVAQIRADGSLDTNFIQQFDCYVRNVAVQPDGKVLVADDCGVVVRFNADATRHQTFAIGLASIQALRPLGDGSILVGGSGGIVRLSKEGEVDLRVSADGDVVCITPGPNGQWLVGGSFSQISDQPRFGLARLNPDGSVDPNFDPGAGLSNGGSVTGIAVGPDGRLLVGGSFIEFAGHPRNGLVRLRSDGIVDETDHTSLPSGFRLASLTPQIGGVVVAALSGWGGASGTIRGIIQRIHYDSIRSVIDFSSDRFGAAQSQGVANINLERRGHTTEPATVSYRAVGPNFLEISGLVEFSAGERFKTIHLPIAGHLGAPQSTVKLDLTDVTGSTTLGLKQADLIIVDDRLPGAADPSFNPFLSFYNPGSWPGWVHANGLAIQPNGGILLSGYLPIDQNGTMASFIRLNADGTLDSSFRTPASAGVVALTVDGKILAADGAYGLQRLLADGSLDTTFNLTDRIPYFGAVVLPLPDRRILVGGANRWLNNNDRIPGIVRLLEDGSFDPTFLSIASEHFFNHATALALTADGSVLVADSEGGQTRLYELTSGGRVNSGFQSHVFDGLVQSLALQSDGRIVVGGTFSFVNQIARAGVARLDRNGALDKSFDPGLGFTVSGTNQTGMVNALLILRDGCVLVGGLFSHVDGVPHRSLAKLDSDGTFDPTYGPRGGFYGTGFNGNSVSSLALTPEGDILVAGQFDHAGPAANPFLVRLRGTAAFEVPAPRLLESGEVELIIPAGTRPVMLEATTQLSPADWKPIVTNNTTAPLIYREAAGGSASQRFYRATRQSN